MILSDEQQQVRDAIADFCRNEIVPKAAQWDREHYFPREIHQALAGLGCYGVMVPQEYGGAGLDAVCMALILEEIGAADGGTSTAISVNNCPVCSILMAFGDANQKRDWLTPLARGEKLGAFCLTEPQAGSNAAEIRTTARR